MDSQGGSFRGFSTDGLVGIPHSNKRGPICYPGAYSSFSTVWFAFSHPSPTSIPRKEMLCRGVLTVTFPLCQSCVARIVPSLYQAALGVLVTLWVFRFGLTHVGVQDFVLFCVSVGGHRVIRLSCAGAPCHLLSSGTRLVLSAAMKALGMWVFYGLGFQLPDGKKVPWMGRKIRKWREMLNNSQASEGCFTGLCYVYCPCNYVVGADGNETEHQG